MSPIHRQGLQNYKKYYDNSSLSDMMLQKNGGMVNGYGVQPGVQSAQGYGVVQQQHAGYGVQHQPGVHQPPTPQGYYGVQQPPPTGNGYGNTIPPTGNGYGNTIPPPTGIKGTIGAPTGAIQTGNLPPPIGNLPPPTGNVSNLPVPTGMSNVSVLGLPAPTESLPAPTGNLPAPTGNLPAPTGNLPAPTGNLPAPMGNLPAPTGNLPPPTGLKAGNLPAPTGNLPVPTTGGFPIPSNKPPIGGGFTPSGASKSSTIITGGATGESSLPQPTTNGNFTRPPQGNSSTLPPPKGVSNSSGVSSTGGPPPIPLGSPPKGIVSHEATSADGQNRQIANRQSNGHHPPPPQTVQSQTGASSHPSRSQTGGSTHPDRSQTAGTQESSTYGQESRKEAWGEPRRQENESRQESSSESRQDTTSQKPREETSNYGHHPPLRQREEEGHDEGQSRKHNEEKSNLKSNLKSKEEEVQPNYGHHPPPPPIPDVKDVYPNEESYEEEQQYRREYSSNKYYYDHQEDRKERYDDQRRRNAEKFRNDREERENRDRQYSKGGSHRQQSSEEMEEPLRHPPNSSHSVTMSEQSQSQSEEVQSSEDSEEGVLMPTNTPNPSAHYPPYEQVELPPHIEHSMMTETTCTRALTHGIDTRASASEMPPPQMNPGGGLVLPPPPPPPLQGGVPVQPPPPPPMMNYEYGNSSSSTNLGTDGNSSTNNSTNSAVVSDSIHMGMVGEDGVLLNGTRESQYQIPSGYDSVFDPNADPNQIPGINQTTSATLPLPLLGSSSGGVNNGSSNLLPPLRRAKSLAQLGLNPLIKPGEVVKKVTVNHSRIDPANIPRPSNIFGISDGTKDTRETRDSKASGAGTVDGRGGKVYSTDKYLLPPPVVQLARSTFIDRGCCSARFIRMTTNQIPYYHQTANCTHIPISCVIQPFATLGERENPIPLIDQGEEGPMRCSRCKAYVNPYFGWVASGREASCNLCGQYFEVPSSYYCALDYSGQRRDRQERPELCVGTVDYIAPSEYYRDSRQCQPQSPYYIFLIEVTKQGMETGYVHQVCQTITSNLEYFPGSNTKIAIITFDSVIHYYDFGQSILIQQGSSSDSTMQQEGLLSADSTMQQQGVLPNEPKNSLDIPSSAQSGGVDSIASDHTNVEPNIHPMANANVVIGEPRLIIQSDVQDPDFAAVSPENAFLDPRIQSSNLVQLLEMIPNLYSNTTNTESCAGAAMQAAVALIRERGGTGSIICFQRTLPTKGVGACINRDEMKLYSDETAGRNDIGVLFEPQEPEFYKTLLETCLDNDITFDHFLLPPQNMYIDVATQSYVGVKSGGDLYYYPNYNNIEFGEQIHYDLSRIILRRQTYGCNLKVRCGRGLSVDNLYSSWDPTNIHDASSFEVSRLTADSTFAITFKHEDLSDNAKNVFLQAAILYTNIHGIKCIRVHTLALSATNAVSSMFRYTCVDTLTNIMMRECVRKEMINPASPLIKSNLVDQVVNMLHAYRINCASTSSHGQLILPESLKLLPLYSGSIFKQIAFRRKNLNARIDARYAQMIQLLGSTVLMTTSLLYPKLIPLHRLQEKHGLPTEIDENIQMPNNVQCSVDRLSLHGIYLWEDGQRIYIYVGPNSTKELLKESFGVEDISQIEDLAYNRPLGARIWAIIQQIRKDKGSYKWMSLRFTNEDTKLLLIEDAYLHELSYVEFLCMVHRRVQTNME